MSAQERRGAHHKHVHVHLTDGAETCRVMSVDGRPVTVRGAEPLTPRDVELLGQLFRAAVRQAEGDR